MVKELRLAGINNIKEANEFLVTYWEKFNEKFAVRAEMEEDSHRQLLLQHDLEKILCYKTQRTLSKNLEIQYDNIIYQIVLDKPSWSLRGAKVTVIKSLEGRIYIGYKNKYLPFKIHSYQEFRGEEINSKEIDRFLKDAKERRVDYKHPWKQEGRAEARIREYRHA